MTKRQNPNRSLPSGEPQTKRLSSVSSGGVKIVGEGKIEAKVATLDVVDLDYDIIQKGSVPKQNAKISSYNHSSLASFGGASVPPVGKGYVEEKNSDLMFYGEYFMDITPGQEAFALVKNTEDDQEWSIGYYVKEASYEENEDYDVLIRSIKDMRVYEVSPVHTGAGIDTGTTSAKKFNMEPEEFKERIREVLKELGYPEEYKQVMKDFQSGSSNWKKAVSLIERRLRFLEAT